MCVCMGMRLRPLLGLTHSNDSSKALLLRFPSHPGQEVIAEDVDEASGGGVLGGEHHVDLRIREGGHPPLEGLGG